MIKNQCSLKKTYSRFSFKKNEGITIVEIAVVIIIVTVIATIGIGTYISNRDRWNMSADGRDLLTLVQQAKTEAIKEGECIGIILDIVNDQFVLFLDDGNGAGTECDAVAHPNESANVNFPQRVQAIRNNVGFALSPTASTAADPNVRNLGTGDHDLFDAISFDPRGIVAARVWNGANASVLFDNINIANASWWGRVIVTPAGSSEFQTNDNPANENRWSR